MVNMDELVRKGAEVMLRELEEQAGKLREILARGPRPGRQTRQINKPVLAAVAAENGVRKKYKMSAAGRAAISAAQKARWAAVRAGNKKAPATSRRG